MVHSGEATNTMYQFYSLWLEQTAVWPTIYCTQGVHAGLYITSVALIWIDKITSVKYTIKDMQLENTHSPQKTWSETRCVSKGMFDLLHGQHLHCKVFIYKVVIHEVLSRQKEKYRPVSNSSIRNRFGL